MHLGILLFAPLAAGKRQHRDTLQNRLSTHQAQDNDDQGDDEQDVNESTANMEPNSEEPTDDENYDNGF